MLIHEFLKKALLTNNPETFFNNKEFSMKVSFYGYRNGFDSEDSKWDVNLSDVSFDSLNDDVYDLCRQLQIDLYNLGSLIVNTYLAVVNDDIFGVKHTKSEGEGIEENISLTFQLTKENEFEYPTSDNRMMRYNKNPFNNWILSFQVITETQFHKLGGYAFIEYVGRQRFENHSFTSLFERRFISVNYDDLLDTENKIIESLISDYKKIYFNRSIKK